jgi:hypothetical protein
MGVTLPKVRRPGQTGITLLWAVVAILTTVAIYAVSQMGTLGDQVTQLKTEVTANRTATFESRSVGCRILVAHGITIPPADPCNDPQVLRYYDPAAIKPAATSTDAIVNRTITCHMLRLMGEDHPSCVGL